MQTVDKTKQAREEREVSKFRPPNAPKPRDGLGGISYPPKRVSPVCLTAMRACARAYKCLSMFATYLTRSSGLPRFCLELCTQRRDITLRAARDATGDSLVPSICKSRGHYVARASRSDVSPSRGDSFLNKYNTLLSSY